ncbi:AraC family transcriptional regulator [Cesiribacter sp. SM1]|uniref:AraC family transcriptional regulator n=1 Tax=Cesiribacter sp. SM1 TaxID=2861196 RepID=UPI001CD3E295|nr:AraC family transcriptional regulator [Cesiribacter sp. SM1]
MPQLSEFLKFDLFAALMLTGIVQGIFLFFLLLPKKHRQPYHYLLLALLVLSFSLLVLEIFMGYTGLITQALALVDFSEPLVFAIGPLTYLLIRSMSGRLFSRTDLLHFLPFLFYTAYHLLFLLEGGAVKYNAFLDAWHPDVAPVATATKFQQDPLYIRRNLEYFILLHISLYMAVSLRWVNRQRNSSSGNPYFLSWVKVLIGFFGLSVLLYLVVRLSFQSDLGDHLMGVLLTLQLFFISYKMLTNSAFFQPVVQQKYEKSTLSDENRQQVLERLQIAEQTKFYLQPSASLAGLASQLSTTPPLSVAGAQRKPGQELF